MTLARGVVSERLTAQERPDVLKPPANMATAELQPDLHPLHLDPIA
ncbi:hypothetical protein [Nonomuraea sp. NPDC049504]